MDPEVNLPDKNPPARGLQFHGYFSQGIDSQRNGTARAEPECGENHPVSAKGGKESSLNSTADDIILSLIDMWFDVVVVFANLKELFEHRRREIGHSELVSFKEKVELVRASPREISLVGLCPHRREMTSIVLIVQRGCLFRKRSLRIRLVTIQIVDLVGMSDAGGI